MSSILYKDVVHSGKVDTITHTSTSGTVTAVTSINNALTRSFLQSYEYTISGLYSGTSTIQLNLTSPYPSVSSLAIVGSYQYIAYNQNLRIELLNISDTVLYATGVPTSRTRYVNGETIRDSVWIFDAVNSVAKIKIIYDDQYEVLSPLINPKIGKIFVGDYFDIDVKPSTLKYTFSSEGEKVRTDGGQIYAAQNNSYLKTSFTCTPQLQSEVVSNHFDLNYFSSVSEPIIFLPQTSGDIIFYGTQEKPCTSRPAMKNSGESSPEWYLETSFQLEEEF